MSDYKRLTKQAGYHKDIDLKDELGYSYIYQRLAELENDYENGKVVKLPCRVGDTIYVIYQYSDFLGTEDEPFIEEDIAKFFVYDENKMKIVPSRYGERNDYWYKVLDILPTLEEAEKRLKELQNG